MRISRYLAKAGLASRREAERLILDGRVVLNGKTIIEPWASCFNTDVLKLDGAVVKLPSSTQIYKLHKPQGYLSTSKDNRGRKTIFDLIRIELDHLMIIGRLDYKSEGLMLLTNNGELKRFLELPKNNFERVYEVKVKGHLTNVNLTKLGSGISIGGISYKPVKAKIFEKTKSYTWIEMILKEGKNREIRRILASFDLTVVRLIRKKFGPFDLGLLKKGETKKLSLEEFPLLRRYWTLN